jgi:hypothetical protein
MAIMVVHAGLTPDEYRRLSLREYQAIFKELENKVQHGN